MPTHQFLPERLAELREKKAYGYRQMARLAEIHARELNLDTYTFDINAIASFEEGFNEPTNDQILALASALDVTPNVLAPPPEPKEKAEAAARAKRDRRFIGHVVARRRTLAGLTQAAVASAIDVRPEVISRIENGKQYPAADTAAALKGLLDLQPVALSTNGATLRWRRLLAGLTQDALAELVHVDRVTIVRWESGTKISGRRRLWVDEVLPHDGGDIELWPDMTDVPA